MKKNNYLHRAKIEFRYAYMSPQEMLNRLKNKSILYLPIGSLEWHNEHLPLGTDTFHAIELAKRLCNEIGGITLPPFWWNTGGCYEHPSTYCMPEYLYRLTIKSVCIGLTPIPAKILVLINGHGGEFQRKALGILAKEMNKSDFPIRLVVADPYELGKSSSCRIDHADTGETSFSLELIPQLVRMGRRIVPDLRSGKKIFANGLPTQKGGNELWKNYFSDAKSLINSEYKKLSP